MVVTMLVGCGNKFYKDDWYIDIEEGSISEDADNTGSNEPIENGEDESSVYPKMIIIADRSESIYGRQDSKGGTVFKGPDNFCNIYQCLDLFKKNYHEIEVYVGDDKNRNDDEKLKPVPIDKIQEKRSESRSWLELLDNNSEVIAEKLDQDALFVFVTDFETPCNVEKFSALLNEGSGTGATIYIFKDHYTGDIDYYREDTIYDTNGRIVEYKTTNCVIQNADLERYYLVIAYGNDSAVHTFMNEFAHALDEIGLDEQLDSKYHLTKNPVKDVELSFPINTVPALSSDMNNVGEYKVDTSNYLFGAEQYVDDDFEKNHAWIVKNTFLFKKNSAVSRNNKTKKIILYMTEPNRLGKYQEMEIDTYERKKNSWVLADNNIFDIQLFDDTEILQDCVGSHNIGCKVLPVSNLNEDEMKPRWIEDLAEKRIATGEYGIFGVVLKNDIYPRGTYAMEVRLKFTDDYYEETDTSVWASQYNQDKSLEVEKYLTRINNITYSWPNIVNKDEGLEEFGKIRHFKNFINTLEGWNSLHERRTYTIRLHLEELNGRKSN